MDMDIQQRMAEVEQKFENCKKVIKENQEEMNRLQGEYRLLDELKAYNITAETAPVEGEVVTKVKKGKANE